MIMSALDFCRAINERGRLWKLLFRLAAGKFAYREYELLILNLSVGGNDPYFEYGCKECSYHKKPMQKITEDMMRSIKKTNQETL